jgi:RecA/RadA recombinase
MEEKPDIEDIENTINNPDNSFLNKGNFKDGVISTGSTVLDLAISSNRIKGGGLPGGIIVEIFGPSQSGKTGALAEIIASCKYKGGAIQLQDPESRFDRSYAEQCDIFLEDHEINRPDTIEDLEEALTKWSPKPKKEGAICVHCADSIAAFSTKNEMKDSNEMDVTKRAKALHRICRKLGRIIYNNNWLIVFTNQEMNNVGTGGKTTPGGKALKYWSSVRIKLSHAYPKHKITKTWKREGKLIEKNIGIRCNAEVLKSLDDPFRKVPVFFLFGKGIDDIRGNLTWLKETKKESTFDCIDRTFSDKQIDNAIQYIEENNLELELREKVIDFWQEIEDHFKVDRKKKVRF